MKNFIRALLALAALATFTAADASIAFVATSGGNSGSSTSQSVTLPTGFNSSGYMTILIVQDNAPSGTITLPSGWTVLYNQLGAAVIYRFWQSGDPSSLSFTLSSSGWWGYAAATYSGVDSTTPIDASNSTIIFTNFTTGGTTESTILKYPSVNPGFNNDMLVLLGGDQQLGGTALSAPSGFTLRKAVNGGTGASLSDKALSTGANTGEQRNTGLTNGGNLNRVGMTVALKQSGSSAATLASPQVTLAGEYVATGSSGTTSPAVTLLNVVSGDLIAIFIGKANTSTVTPPSGYTAVQSASGGGLWTHTWHSGDTTTPSFTYGTTTASVVHALTLTGIGSTNSPAVDVSGVNTGTGSVSVSSLTPTGTNVDYAWFAAWNPASGSGSATGLAPGTMTTDENFVPNNCATMLWQQGVTSALGAFTATLNGGSGSQAGVAALFSEAAVVTAHPQPTLILN